ncbi:MAG: lytic transglycosylase domain-containing protein [Bacteroidota bacterium]|nr:lytic transglycosylase domain-containing protein [Bacteroidota bacterium]MDP4211173.1 lytic transglycosylase domain-containing protein [Bacteroidota bacterium]MDP4249428.1 lytic transglycosylase domain-containing protein [Bacteroidota bacterium]
MKRLLLLGFAFIALVLNSRADALKRDKTSVSLCLPIDTSDLSNGLDNLFLASVRGSNGALLNPRAINYVKDFMAKNRKDLEEIQSAGRSYLRLIDGILSQYGLPSQLKYLAMIESELKPTAVSCVGAAGPWQLMPATARILGLKVNRRVDERKNYRKSTQAAAAYLKDLYAEFGDWLLVIAAYNGGDGNVYRAMKRSHSTNFWNLEYYLPRESRNHVKKFIGTQYTLEGQGSVTTLTKKEAAEQLSGSSMYVFTRKINKDEDANAKTLTVSGKYNATAISKYVLMDMGDFNRYNPDFDKVMASDNNSYDLKLPADKMDLFVSDKYQILNESVQQLMMEENIEENNKTIAGIVRK